MDNQSRVRVGIRLKPEIGEERANIAELLDPCGLAVQVVKREGLQEPELSNYNFFADNVFNEKATQRDVFESCAKPLLQNLLEGYNCTLLACKCS